MSWQPIASAPWTGLVDLAVPRGDGTVERVTDCYRCFDGAWTSKNFRPEEYRTVIGPTHWMRPPPLPY